MRIEILANGIGSVSELQQGLTTLHTNISATIDDLRSVCRKMDNLPAGGIGRLSGAYNNVKDRIRIENNRLTALEQTKTASSEFINNTVATDFAVAKTVTQEQKKFFETHPWLKPVVPEEKSWWEQRVEDWNNFWNSAGEAISSVVNSIVKWAKEHIVEIAIGAVAIVAGAAIVALTGGTAAAFLPAIWGGIKAAGASALISGVISSTLAFLSGGDVLSAFGDGLADGFMRGGILFFASSLVSGLFKIHMMLHPDAPYGRRAGLRIGEYFKILSPDKLATDGQGGGTLFKIIKGRFSGFRFDVDTRVIGGFHLHLFEKGAHIPIGLLLTGLFSGVHSRKR